ncbi:unnamed protein product [Closterium sp. NIES-65]|nr:unnamed protein product [Closterium sp. NIES-65]
MRAIRSRRTVRTGVNGAPSERVARGSLHLFFIVLSPASHFPPPHRPLSFPTSLLARPTQLTLPIFASPSHPLSNLPSPPLAPLSVPFSLSPTCPLFHVANARPRIARYDLGRQAANTKLSSHKTVRRIRVRGGNYKFRALRLDTGNYAWGSESVTRKTRILDVAYNASNNELVRTQTLVKNAIIQVDAAPFRQWYQQHYGVDLGKKKSKAGKKEVRDGGGGVRVGEEEKAEGEAGEEVKKGKELEFYMKKLQKKKGKSAA